MGLVTPDYGLIVWMLLSFSILLFILKKFAWTPILQGLKHREDSIARALAQAEQARAEMQQLEQRNRDLAEQSRREREQSLAELKQLRERLVAEAKEEAKEEARRLVEKAHAAIAQERLAVSKELQQQAAMMAVEISEKILRRQLADGSARAEYIDQLIGEVNVN
ncbi:MAG: F0F1 ATP synthase subunit B [Bacteroidales bacterium]|nr:F0F1 ATP synthase subunit B [Bacteroidales bacterium]